MDEKLRPAAGAGCVARAALTPTPGWLRIAKPLMFLAGLFPLARLVALGFTGGLGANPIEFVTRSTGLWTLVILCLTLAVTPLRRLTGVNACIGSGCLDTVLRSGGQRQQRCLTGFQG